MKTFPTQAFHINTQKISETLAITSFILFSLASVQEIYFSTALKSLTDIGRAITIFIFFAIYIKKNRIPKKLFIAGLFFLGWGIALKDTFILDAACGLYFALFISRTNKEKITRKITWTIITLTAGTVALSETGLIESKTFTNTLFNEAYLSTSTKESFGFWQPNIATLLIISCMLSGFYLNNKKILITSFLLYLYILQETLSRTYLPIPIAISAFYASQMLPMQKKTFIDIPALTLSIFSILAGWLLALPSLLAVLVSSETIRNLDILFSYRISIAKKATEQLSFIEALTGLHENKVQIDSLYINYIISQGIISFLIATIIIITVTLRLFKKRKSKELLIISLYLLISNFESTASANSLLFFIFIFCLTESKFPQKKVAVSGVDCNTVTGLIQVPHNAWPSARP